MNNNSETRFDATTVQHYISVVANKIQVLTQKVDEISQHDYTSPSPIALSEILIRILSRFLDHLKSLSIKAAYQPPEDIIRAVYAINHILVSIIPELIEAIEGADNDAPMASVIEAYEFIGSQVQYGTQTIIHPTWEYNASSNEIMKYLKKITGSLSQEASKAIFSGAPLNFVIITYPKAEEPIVLRQALIAHEVGHFIEESINKWSDSLFNEQLLNPKDIEDIFTKTQNDDKGELQSKIMQIIERMALPWLKEIISDFLAISMMGPAYLFAFDEISFSPKYSYPRKLSLSHPPDQLRKAIMGVWITKMFTTPVRKSKEFRNFSKEQLDVFEKVSQRVEVISQGDNIQFNSIGNNTEFSQDILNIVYSALKNVLEKSALILQEQKFKTIENEQWICRVVDIVDAIKLEDLLLHGLTPTELYETPLRDPSFAAVMNSGWFHLIRCEKDYFYFTDSSEPTATPEQITTRYINLQNLVAKGIESLHFKREFDRRKGM